MSDSLPEMNLVPKTVVQLAIPSDPFYTMESPQEIREMLSEMNNNYSGEGVDGSGLLVLTGIELHTRPEVLPTPVDMSVHPNMSVHPSLIAWMKDVHIAFWEDQLRLAAQQNEQWRNNVADEGGGDPLHGLPDPVRQLIEGLTSGRATVVSPGGNPMTLEQFQAEGGADVQCCCSHPAGAHEVGDRVMGSCASCGCTKFHTHDEEPDEDQAED